MTDTLETETFDVEVTEIAYDQLMDIAEENNRLDHFLRIIISQFGLGIALDNTLTENDIFTQAVISDGILLTVVTERDLLELVDGVVIDYQTIDDQTGFTVVNPTWAPPVASCGSCTGEVGCC